MTKQNYVNPIHKLRQRASPTVIWMVHDKTQSIVNSKPFRKVNYFQEFQSLSSLVKQTNTLEQSSEIFFSSINSQFYFPSFNVIILQSLYFFQGIKQTTQPSKYKNKILYSKAYHKLQESILNTGSKYVHQHGRHILMIRERGTSINVIKHGHNETKNKK